MNTLPVRIPNLVSVISAGQIREDAYLSDIEKATEKYKIQSAISTNQLPDGYQPITIFLVFLKVRVFYVIFTCNSVLKYVRVTYTLKAILQVLIYKALYDKSYLGSKTTMTSGEWTCLISFATAPLTCSERRGSEKFKMKIYVSSGIRTHAQPVHDR